MMKALIICPSDRPAVRFLAQANPLVNLAAFGKPLIGVWLEHLKGLGAQEITILAVDRPEKVRAVVGDGSRWGVRVEVKAEEQELSPEAARVKYCTGDDAGWLKDENGVVLADHFPGRSEQPLFKSYANWFNGLRAWMPNVAAAKDNGAKEIRPGVWVSTRARVSPDAELRAPCWIGAHTVVGPDTIIGPMAVLEDRVIVGASVEISNSAVAPETFVGELTELKDSLAEGSILINWRTASCARVPDTFILCAMGKRLVNMKVGNWLGRLAALLVMALTFPLALLPLLWARLRHRPAVRSLNAVRPNGGTQGTGETVAYSELTSGPGWLRSWPQLWSVVKGDFSWVGNRPLNPAQVAELASDFERLWLAAPIGLISLAHAEGAMDALETRAWASLYAVQANWKLDLSILARVFVVATRQTVVAMF